MRLTTERKVCAGVLLLAVAALAVDRLVLGGVSGPASASAAELLVSTAEHESAATSPAPRLVAAVGETVAVQLAALPTKDAMSDAFAPPEKWAAAIRKASADAASLRLASEIRPQTDAPADPIMAKFKSNHQLTTVVGERGRPDWALVRMVGGGEAGPTRPLRVGDELNGFKLIELTATTATFQEPMGERTVELTIKVAGTSE